MDVFRYAYTSSALQTHFVLRFDFEILLKELGLYFYPVCKCHKKQVRLFWFNEQAISVFSRLGKEFTSLDSAQSLTAYLQHHGQRSKPIESFVQPL